MIPTRLVSGGFKTLRSLRLCGELFFSESGDTILIKLTYENTNQEQILFFGNDGRIFVCYTYLLMLMRVQLNRRCTALQIDITLMSHW